MRHATPSLRSFFSPSLKWTAASLAAGILAVLSPSARAADPAPPAPAPAATQPAAGLDVAPQPAAPAAAPAEEKPSKILVTSFSTVSGRPGDSWLGRSIQQSVMTDLMTAQLSRVTSTIDSPADAAAALDLGRKLGARYVVFGQVHVNNAAVRVTGEIVSTATDQPVAALKATGSMNDLFPMEDALGSQALRALGRLQFADLRARNAGNPANGANTATAQAEPPPVIEPSGPVQAPYPAVPEAPYTYTPYPVAGDYSGPPVVEYDPYPVYGYPDYGYGFYPYYPGIIIGGAGFGGRGFNHGFGGHFGGTRFGGAGRIGGAGHFGGVGHVGGVGHGGGFGHGGGHGGGHR